MKTTRHPSTPQAIVLRCHVVLGAAGGIANNELARQLCTSLPTVLLWRRRFEQQGLLAILEDKHRSGRPRALTPEKEAAIVEATRNTKPHHATHWSVRSMARSQGVSSATIQRIWKAYHLQPHLVEVVGSGSLLYHEKLGLDDGESVCITVAVEEHQTQRDTG